MNSAVLQFSAMDEGTGVRWINQAPAWDLPQTGLAGKVRANRGTNGWLNGWMHGRRQCTWYECMRI